MSKGEFKEYVDLWSMRLNQASISSGKDRVRELLIECLMRYGGKVNKEAYNRHKVNKNKDE
jgi:hypothetical protein